VSRLCRPSKSSVAVFAVVLSAAVSCGGAADPISGAATVAPSTARGATPAPVSPTPAVLTRSQAAERYRTLADAYRKARAPLDQALDGEPVDMAAVRNGGAVAPKAYRARIAGLLETPWPADVKPLVDDYVTKAAAGLNLLLVAAKAKSVSDILDSGAQNSTDAINAADTLVRVKLGLPTVDQP
jgi:hypothetical protein